MSEVKSNETRAKQINEGIKQKGTNLNSARSKSTAQHTSTTGSSVINAIVQCNTIKNLSGTYCTTLNTDCSHFNMAIEAYTKSDKDIARNIQKR